MPEVEGSDCGQATVRHHGGEVLAPEPTVGRRGPLADRLGGRLDDLAWAEHDGRRGCWCGPAGGRAGEHHDQRCEKEVPWRPVH